MHRLWNLTTKIVIELIHLPITGQIWGLWALQPAFKTLRQVRFPVLSEHQQNYVMKPLTWQLIYADCRLRQIEATPTVASMQLHCTVSALAEYSRGLTCELLSFGSSSVRTWRLLSSTGFWWRVDKTWRQCGFFCLWLRDCRSFVGRPARMKMLWHFGPDS